MLARPSALLLALVFPPLALTAQDGVVEPPAGFTPLFDGVSLDGWWGMGTEDPRPLLAMSAKERQAKVAASLDDIRAHWKVVDGVLVNDGAGLFLTTQRDFGDFELRLDYRTVAGADSGIYLRGIPQVQIWDTTKEGGKWKLGADKGSGGLWNNSAGAWGKDPLAYADRPFGEWNAVRIVMIGEFVSVWLNDQKVVDDARLENYFDRKAPLPRTGPIQLQTHGGEIRWRKLYVRNIAADEARAHLRQRRSAATMVGKFGDMEGGAWSGNVAGYEAIADAVDGLPGVACRPGSGGNLFTSEQYGDFVADFMFKLPPGGNNGLAIRYPGKGDPAYAGMCELQVLDDSASKYAGLDVRQFHGSAYGMVAARRGYQAPAGEWNHQRVRVEGSTIQVELNGFRILNADLSSVDSFMAETAHPGKDRRRGAFGFCGHGDPVAFAGLQIGEIEKVDGPWIDLFDGASLAGWTPRGGTAEYVVEDGVIVGTTAVGSPNSFLCTDQEYGDFELEFEVKLDSALNSGVQIRSASKDPASLRSRVFGPQIEVEAAPGDAGLVYSEGTGRGWITPEDVRKDPIKLNAFRNEQWNHFRVLAVGRRVQTWVNGIPAVDLSDATSRQSGFIGLQVHNIPKGKGPFQARWRNLRIRTPRGE